MHHQFLPLRSMICFGGWPIEGNCLMHVVLHQKLIFGGLHQQTTVQVPMITKFLQKFDTFDLTQTTRHMFRFQATPFNLGNLRVPPNLDVPGSW